MPLKEQILVVNSKVMHKNRILAEYTLLVPTLECKTKFRGAPQLFIGFVNIGRKCINIEIIQ